MTRKVRWGVFLAVLALPLVAPAPARSEDPPKEPKRESGKVAEELKKAGREFVEDAKSVGRDVRDSDAMREVEAGTREFGRDATEASRAGWEKTKSISGSAADEVRRATREFWNDVLRTKKAAAEKLRKENAELKSKKGEKSGRSEPAKEAE